MAPNRPPRAETGTIAGVLANLRRAPKRVRRQSREVIENAVSQLFDAAVDGSLQRVVFTDVDFGGHHASTGVLDHSGGDIEVFGCCSRRRRCFESTADVHRDDVGTLLRQPDRVTSALPARSAGHERDFAVHPAHLEPPLAAFWAIAQFRAHAMFSSPVSGPSRVASGAVHDKVGRTECRLN